MLNVGDFNRSGLVQITDTHWNGNGTLYVTVREMIGGRDSWVGGKARMIRAMRDTARQAASKPETTRGAPLSRLWYAGGQYHATFRVTRLERWERA